MDRLVEGTASAEEIEDLLKNHLLHPDALDGFQFFFHAEDFFLFPEHFQEDKAGGRAYIFTDLVQAEAGLYVTSVFRKELLHFRSFGQPVGDLDSQDDLFHSFLLNEISPNRSGFAFPFILSGWACFFQAQKAPSSPSHPFIPDVQEPGVGVVRAPPTVSLVLAVPGEMIQESDKPAEKYNTYPQKKAKSQKCGYKDRR